MNTDRADIAAACAHLCKQLVRSRFAGCTERAAIDIQIDMQSLIAFAGMHGSGAALAKGTRNADLKGEYAAGLKLLLEAAEESTAANNAQKRNTLAQTGLLLAAASIECCALKGGAFLAETDEPVGWRALSDLDVLVQEDQLQSAVRILTSAGFQHAMEEEGYRQQDHYHYPPLIAPDADFALELHTRFSWDKDKDPLNPEAVLHASLPSRLEGITVPRSEHRIGHLIAHAQIGDKGYAARRISLKDIVDLGELIAAHPVNWSEIEADFTRTGSRPLLSGFLLAAQDILAQTDLYPELDLTDGVKWSAQALQNFSAGRTDQSYAALDIAQDYARRVLFRKDGLKLFWRTITSTERLSSLWQTQSRKWRG